MAVDLGGALCDISARTCSRLVKQVKPGFWRSDDERGKRKRKTRDAAMMQPVEVGRACLW